MSDNKSAFNSNEYENKIKQTLPYYDEFYEQVIDLVRTYNNNALIWLDVGCGTGKMAVQKYYEALKKNGLFISFENFAPFSDLGKQLYLDKVEIISSKTREKSLEM